MPRQAVPRYSPAGARCHAQERLPSLREAGTMPGSSGRGCRPAVPSRRRWLMPASGVRDCQCTCTIPEPDAYAKRWHTLFSGPHQSR
jgi:hypothetical protein